MIFFLELGFNGIFLELILVEFFGIWDFLSEIILGFFNGIFENGFYWRTFEIFLKVDNTWDFVELFKEFLRYF